MEGDPYVHEEKPDTLVTSDRRHVYIVGLAVTVRGLSAAQRREALLWLEEVFSPKQRKMPAVPGGNHELQ